MRVGRRLGPFSALADSDRDHGDRDVGIRVESPTVTVTGTFTTRKMAGPLAVPAAAA
jgi:hypothetical protein